MKTARIDLLLCMGLVALVATVYHTIPHTGFFLYDDSLYVYENPAMSLGLSWEGVKWAFTTTRGGFWIPVTWLSLLTDAQIFGLNPGGFHLTNILLHALNTLLLFAVLNKMTGAPFKSAFAAALFAVHPMHVESVAWITERKDVLFGLFWLLSMGAYLKFVKNPGWKNYALILLLFILGLMAKPMMVTLPFALLLLDYWPLKRISPEEITQAPKRIWALVREKTPLFAVSLVFSLATFILQRHVGAVASLEGAPLSFRIPNAFISYFKYAYHTLWPVDIAVYYPIPENPLPHWMWIGALLILAAVTFLAAFRWKTDRCLIVGWLFFLGVMFPVIGVSQSGPQAMAARFMYIPAIGLYIMAAWGGPELFRRAPSKKAVAAGAGIGLVLALTLLGYNQARAWEDGIALMKRSMQITGENPFASYLIGVAALRKQDYPAAEKYLRESLTLKEKRKDALEGLSIALNRQGKTEEAITCIKKALEIEPDSIKAKSYLGTYYFKAGFYEDGRKIRDEVVQADPKEAIVLYNIATMFFDQMDYKNAKTWFQKNIKANPFMYEAYTFLGAIALKQGETDAALANYLEALNLHPDLPQVHNLVGLLYIKKGLAAPAEAHFRESMRQAPGFLDAPYNLACLYDLMGNEQAAQALLKTLIKTAPQYQEAIDKLEQIRNNN
ncbi:Tfp pilus assembly protein PilF [Desulfatibacillum alkenivorans DSM 16219]|jgi:tetratricopeptide (TPR) repeat protein|uniref:Tfp pilus assembly protein PilF n=1 Tax=Desulfatibacillum alkenivorans DSM 16219 TaxID=1121393 RepID=A0A1M6LRN2_9BACT|nr:tetratricopeptide repeat protein [Desulfatibacillum alkenivorans]SHJ73806.1 Tfp pilus assembly protein PilF [Desulfatibacillum alkenivorans DSM 16219]